MEDHGHGVGDGQPADPERDGDGARVVKQRPPQQIVRGVVVLQHHNIYPQAAVVHQRVGSAAMKLIYKPLGVIAALIGGRIGDKVFRRLWAWTAGGDPPELWDEDVGIATVVAARSLEAALIAGFGSVTKRLSMRLYRHLTGVWPGAKPPEPEDGTDDEAP
jgi:hypothetical protein